VVPAPPRHLVIGNNGRDLIHDFAKVFLCCQPVVITPEKGNLCIDLAQVILWRLSGAVMLNVLFSTAPIKPTKSLVLDALCILEHRVGGCARCISTSHYRQHGPVHLGLIVADKEEDGVLAHRSKGSEVAAGGFREQVAHPVGGEELARSCGEAKSHVIHHKLDLVREGGQELYRTPHVCNKSHRRQEDGQLDLVCPGGVH